MGRTVRVNCDIVSEVDVFTVRVICELSGAYSEGEL